MTTASDLLESIRQAPEEDAPRLLYADWLEEFGDASQSARADFIRVQIALADPPEDPQARRALWERESALLKKYQQKWFAPLKSNKAKDGKLDRGLIEQVTIPGNQLLDHADALFAAEPIHILHLTNPRRVVRDLATLPALARVRTLQLQDDNLAPEQVAELLSSSHLAALTGLELIHVQLGMEGVKALVGSGLRLTFLNLVGSRLESAAARILASARSLRLDRLDFTGWIMNDEDRATILASPMAAQVRDLRLSSSEFGEETLRVLASGAGPTQLESLDTSSVNSSQVRELCLDGPLSRLRQLKLHPTAPGCVAILAEAHFEHLEALDLWPAHLSNAELTTLARAPWAPGLRSLSLSNYPGSAFRIDDTGLATLAQSYPNLRALHLQNVDLSAAGIRALVKSPLARSLRVLSFGMNPLPDEAFQVLASGQFPRLLRLQAGGSDLGPAGVRALIESGLIVQLDTLVLVCLVQEHHLPLVKAAIQAGLQKRDQLTFLAPTCQERRKPLWRDP